MKPYNEEGKTKKEQVREMFNHIAPTYDRLNHILSADIDKFWRRRVMRIVRRSGAKRILDIATGTGDLAIVMARGIRGSHIMGVDISEQMLARATDKINRQGLDERIILSQGDVEHLEVATSSVDAVTIGFGVRNFENLPASLAEIFRVLHSGGCAVILEFSVPRNTIIRRLYGAYAHRVLPEIGAMISHDRRAYDYLPASIEEFPAPELFLKMLHKAGFAECRARRQLFGIAHIYIARKQ